MIVNVKSLMAVLMATILMLAVVIPITGAMASMSTEKGTKDNEVGDGSLMARAGTSADLMITNSGGAVQLYVGDADGVVLESRQFIFSDDFYVEVGSGFFTLSPFGSSSINSIAGSYMTIHNGQWAYYNTDSPRNINEVKQFKEIKEQKETGNVNKAVTPDAQGTFSYVFYPDAGKWLYTSSPVNVDSGTTFYMIGEGKIVSGTLAGMAPMNFSAEGMTITCDYTATEYSNSLTAVNVTMGGDTEVVTSGFLVPLAYSDGEKMGMTGTLVSLIPVVMIVGVIIAAVSMMILRRQEDSL